MDVQKQDASGKCSLEDPKVRNILDRLHRSAKGDLLRFPGIGLAEVLDRVLRRNPTVAERGRRMQNVYVPISREQGVFAYLTARSLGAQRIIEFGTSFAVSTIYFAAAIRDNGGGIVIGSEIEETKIAKAWENLKEAGLDEHVEIRPGDAQQTLADPGGPVDLLLMDGWKNMYLPLIEMLTPHLRPGAIVLSDNIDTFKRTLAPYVEHMQNPANGFQSVKLPLGDGLLYSVRLPG